MIDMIKAKKAFKRYIKNYDETNGRTTLKIEHIMRTAEMSRQIAEDLKLKQEDIKLATLIGLLHDIGRFEQIKRYDTFSDSKSINHGELGVEILFSNDFIREFVEEDIFDNIIRVAILNHNRNQIEDGLTEREKLHAKIIRDADKTDIMYVLTSDKIRDIWGKDSINDSILTPEIYREFIEDKEIQYHKKETEADDVISHLAYLYDFNYPYGLQKIKEKGYIDTYLARFDFQDEYTRKKILEAGDIAKQYIEGIKEGKTK